MPRKNIFIGFFLSLLNGCAGPISGWIIIKCMFAMVMFDPKADTKNEELKAMNIDPIYYNADEMKVELRIWLIAMSLVAFISGILKFFT